VTFDYIRAKRAQLAFIKKMAPKEAGKKPAGKAPAKTAEKKASKDGKKRKVTRKETFNTYIYKVFFII